MVSDAPEASSAKSRTQGVIRNFSWNLAGQVCTAAAMLGVIPFAIRNLGATRYGVYALAATSVVLLQQFDGGLVNTATRYIALSFGKGERDQATRLFTSTLIVVSAAGALLGAAVAFFAGFMADIFHVPASLHPDAIRLALAVAILTPVSMIFTMFQAVLQAVGHFKMVNLILISTSIIRTIGLLLCSWGGQEALSLIAFMLIGLQGLALILIVPPAMRQLQLSAVGFISWTELRELLIYGSKVQIFSVSYLVNMQSDAVVVGLISNLRTVAMYSIGANIAFQIRSVVSNATYPMGVAMADSLGRFGVSRAFEEFKRLQNNWVWMASLFFAVLIPSSFFMIVAWVGEEYWRAGLICAILLTGYAVNTLTTTLTLYLHVIGRPGIEARYGIASMLCNVVLTASLFELGPFAVVGSTAVGTIVGSLFLLRLTHRRVSSEIPSFITLVPIVPAAGGCAVAFGLGVALRSISPSGVLGIIFAALYIVPAAVFGLGLHSPGRNEAIRRGRQALSGWARRS